MDDNLQTRSTMLEQLGELHTADVAQSVLLTPDRTYTHADDGAKDDAHRKLSIADLSKEDIDRLKAELGAGGTPKGALPSNETDTGAAQGNEFPTGKWESYDEDEFGQISDQDIMAARMDCLKLAVHDGQISRENVIDTAWKYFDFVAQGGPEVTIDPNVRIEVTGDADAEAIDKYLDGLK